MGLQTDDKSSKSGSRKSSAVGLLRRVRLGPVAALAIGGATLIVAIAIGTFVAVLTFRDRAVETSKQQLETTVLLLSRHFESYIQNFTGVQRALIREFKPMTTLPPQEFALAMASPQTHTLLVMKVSGLRDVVGVTIWGREAA